MTPAPGSDADTELMLRLQDGEDVVLNQLMDHWQQRLVGYIMRYVGCEADAMDLAQETFVRVYEKRAQYRPKAKFSTWLFTIAGNLCRNHARWKARRPDISLDCPDDSGRSADDRLADPAPSPQAAAETADIAAAVQAAVGILPHDLKTTVILFEYQDLTYQEIGAILKCSSKAVETRLYRARNILRKKLAALNSGEPARTPAFSGSATSSDPALNAASAGQKT